MPGPPLRGTLSPPATSMTKIWWWMRPRLNVAVRLSPPLSTRMRSRGGRSRSPIPTATSSTTSGPELVDAVGERLRDAGTTPSESASKLARALVSHYVSGYAERPEPDAKSSAGEVVLAYLAEQLDKLFELDFAVRRDDPDAVHKMRVSARRMRSALATYRRLLDPAVTDPLRDELKWLGGVLGSVCDAEVIRDHLRQALDEQSRALVVGPVRRHVDTSLRADHRRAHERVLVDLTDERYFRLLDTLDAVAAGGVLAGPRVTKPARKVLAKEIGRTHARLRKLVEAAADVEPTDHALHEVCKAAKRMRYAAESGVPVFGSDAAGLVTRMQTVQDVLGEHQHSVVVRQILVDMGGPSRRGRGCHVHLRTAARARGGPGREVRGDLPGDGRRQSRRPAPWLR